MSHQALRIAVLECDTPLQNTQKRYGGYGGVFKALLEAGAESYATSTNSPIPALEISKFDVVNLEQYPSLDDIDAVLLTGSRHNSFDNEPWILKLVDFVKQVLAQHRVRLIGVCFGHQIIGRAMGSKVDRSDAGWEVSVTPMELTDAGRRVFGADEEMSLHQMHKDIVYDYPDGVEELAHSDRCAVQGMYLKDRMISVQGHPEFTEEIVTELLESRHASGVFDDGMYKDGMGRVGKRHDGVVVSKGFIRFLLKG